jgi:hypothetical protein
MLKFSEIAVAMVMTIASRVAWVRKIGLRSFARSEVGVAAPCEPGDAVLSADEAHHHGNDRLDQSADSEEGSGRSGVGHRDRNAYVNGEDHQSQKAAHGRSLADCPGQAADEGDRCGDHDRQQGRFGQHRAEIDGSHKCRRGAEHGAPTLSEGLSGFSHGSEHCTDGQRDCSFRFSLDDRN